MPRCIECAAPISRIINPETQTVERCTRCGSSCDQYYEFGKVQLWIDVTLLQRQAWRHILFNESDSAFVYVAMALCSCLIEAFVVRSVSVFRTLATTTPPSFSNSTNASGTVTLFASTSGLPADASLQIVKIIQSPTLLPLMDYKSTLLYLFFYACAEYMLLTVIAVWVGNRFRPKDVAYEDVLDQWARAVGYAYRVKYIYCLFFIWFIPLSVLPVVDAMFLLWLARAFWTLSLQPSMGHGFIGVLLCFGARAMFRHLSSWNTQF